MDNGRPTTEQEIALGRLVEQGTLSTEQAHAVRSVLWGANAVRGRVNPAIVLIEVAGYAGGVLMLGGVTLLLGLSWAQLSRGAHIAMLIGVAVALAGAALLVAGGPRRLRMVRDGSAPVRRRLVGVLFALGAVPAAFAGGVAADNHQALIGGSVGLIVAVAGYALVSTAVGLIFAAIASLIVTFGALEATQQQSQPAISLAVVGLGLVWVVATSIRVATPRPLGWAISGAFTIFGAQLALSDQDTRVMAYAVTMAAAVAAFLLYWREGSPVLLVAGVIGVTLAVPEAISDWTNGALSGPAILLIAGAVLVGVSALGLRLRGARRGQPE